VLGLQGSYFLYLFGKLLVLSADISVLVGDVSIVCDYTVEFGVDGDVVGPHLVVKVFVVFLHLHHFWVGAEVLD
jgi:hypothetical protein